MSVSLYFGPIKADQLEHNATVQLLKGWQGIELEFSSEFSQGNDFQQVKALRKKLAN